MKKTIKNIFGLIFITIMLLSVSVANADNDFGISLFSTNEREKTGSYGDNITYYYNADKGILRFSGTGNMRMIQDSRNSPWYDYRNSFTTVEIGEGITDIGDYAFYGFYNLTNIKIPNSVTKIGRSAFASSGLTEIVIPKNVTTIDEFAFNATSLTKATFYPMLKNIDSYAFRGLYGKLNDIYFKGFKADNKINIEYDALALNGKYSLKSDVTWHYMDEIRIAPIEDQYYHGSAIKPKVTVKHYISSDETEEVLTEGKDYTLTYTDNDKVGTATVTVTGIGDYTGETQIANFNILNGMVSNFNIASISNQIYTGSVIMPMPTITCNNKTLTKEVDYTLSYSNNINVGTATITITGKGNFKGTTSKTFSISARAMTDTSVANVSSQTYTGNVISPLLTITYNNKTLKKDTDYTLSYSNNINAGTATITITGKGNFTGTTSKTFSISARAMTDTSVANVSSQTYTGNVISPLPTITYNNKTLKKDTDYILSYSNNINAGTATITITGKGNFTGTTSKTFSISARAMSDTSVANISSQTYTGNGISPLPTITYNNKTLKKDTDYTLSYSDNINAGTATITITGKGNFTGMTSTTFIITQKSAEKLNISEIANQIYTGKEIKPNVVITDTER